MKDWNSNQYAKFEKERTQPSVDLIHRIHISPKLILDIGCGPGNSTKQLSASFSAADILGIDSSDNMLDKARCSYPYLKFQKCVIPVELDRIGTFDLIFSNACLHWVADHQSLFPKLMDKLHPGGMLAVQMPLVQNAVFYRVLEELIAEDKWKRLRDIHVFHNQSPDKTYDILSGISKEVTMWDTTYYHIMPSHGSIIDWYKGSGLRPYLDALSKAEEAEFLCDLLRRMKNRFPVQSDNSIILKMPGLFFTAMK